MSTFNSSNAWENVSSPQSNGWTTDTTSNVFWQKQQQQQHQHQHHHQQHQSPKLSGLDVWSDAHSQFNGWNAPQSSSIPQKYVFTDNTSSSSSSASTGFHPKTSLEITTNQPQLVLSSDSFTLSSPHLAHAQKYSAKQTLQNTTNAPPRSSLMFSPPGILQQQQQQQQQQSLSPIGNHSFKPSSGLTHLQVASATSSPTTSTTSSAASPPPPPLPDNNNAASDADGAKPDIEEHLNTQNLYKTELCRSFRDTGSCRYGTKCQFAHGREELRPVLRHPKYKTEVCKTFHTLGRCPYGKRCRFIHLSPDEANSNSVNILHWGNNWNPQNPQSNPSSSSSIPPQNTLVQSVKTSSPPHQTNRKKKNRTGSSQLHRSQQQHHHHQLAHHANSVQSLQQQQVNSVFNTAQQQNSDFLTVTYSPSLSKNYNDPTHHSLVNAFSGLSLSSPNQPKLAPNSHVTSIQPKNEQQQQLNQQQNERRLSFFARLTGKYE